MLHLYEGQTVPERVPELRPAQEDVHLSEGVRSLDRSTYMKGFQSSDLPRRTPHLYEEARRLRPFHLYKGVPELRPAQEDVPPI